MIAGAFNNSFFFKILVNLLFKLEKSFLYNQFIDTEIGF